MSHITIIEPEIQVQEGAAKHQLPVKFLNLDLLKQALQLACEGQGTVGEGACATILDYYNHEKHVALCIRTPKVQRGIGFIKKGAEYALAVDAFGIERQATELINKISQRYIQLSVTRATQRQGYVVQAQEKEGTVKLLARRY